MEDVQMQCWQGEASTRKFDWLTVTVSQAFRNEGPFRCPECRQPVRLHRASAKQAAHAEHRTKNTKCSLCYRFEGQASGSAGNS